MIALLKVILFFPIIYDTVKCFVFIFYNRNKKNEIGNTSSNSNNTVVILLPAFREQLIASKILEQWTNLARSFPFLRIYVITTSREEKERENLSLLDKPTLQAQGYRQEDIDACLSDNNRMLLKTTYDLLTEHLEKIDAAEQIHILQYSGEERGKYSQLNHAIGLLNTQREIGDDTYIGVYDFDSYPSPDTFESLARYNTHSDSPDVLQQPALPVLGLEKASIFGVCDAYHHYIRTFFNEVFVWSAWNKLDRFPNLRSMLFCLYFVGIGLFMKEKFFLNVLGMKFPGPVDDLPIGFKAARTRSQIRPLSSFCRIEAYPDLKSSIRSRKLVFYAYVEELLSSIKNPLRLTTSAPCRSFLFLLLGVPLYALALIFFILIGNYDIAVFALCGYILLSSIKAFLCQKLAKRENPKAPNLNIKILALCPFTVIWRWASACWALYAGVQAHISGNKANFSKTIRN